MSTTENQLLIEKMRLLVPETIDDEDMACGGRYELDKRLRRVGDHQVTDASECIECTVNTICILGLARSSK